MSKRPVARRHFINLNSPPSAGLQRGPADKEGLLREVVRSSLLSVTTDALIALSGATAGAAGIITIAGTGSISYGRNAAKKSARAGGWGYIYGDEGGGFDLTRQAIRALLRNEEGWGPETILRQMLLGETGASNANDLMHRLYTDSYPRPRIASFAKLVDEAAIHGDNVARNIIMNAAQQLAGTTSAVRTQLFDEFEQAEVAYIGGVFRSEMLLERFRMLVELETGNRVIAPRFGPAVGALLEAYALAGLSVVLTDAPGEK
ncbi:MAG: BadF/BadG/BcrA/BcrD ATPase family protein [Bryobacteraceae bacterium]